MKRQLYKPNPTVYMNHQATHQYPMHKNFAHQRNYQKSSLANTPMYQQPAIQQPIIQRQPYATNKPVITQHQDYDVGIFLKSSIDIRFQQITTYEKLLNQYDRILTFNLLDQRILMHQALVMEIQMQPENMFWMNWKHSDQILEFFQEIQTEIVHMMQFEQRKLKTGSLIAKKYHEIYNAWTLMNQNQQNKLYGNMSQDMILKFIEWINLVGAHPFLRKTIPFLIFIDHCLPMDKWNMLVYQQMYIRKPFGILDKMSGLIHHDKKLKRRKQYFLTITGDGIIKSDDHLLLSNVESMIPFTNLMKVKQERLEEDIIFDITSGLSQAWRINFRDDYVSAINFACGLGRARIDAFYKAPYKAMDPKNTKQFYQKEEAQNIHPHRFSSFAPQRLKCSVKLYNDGCGYFQDMYECMMNAKFQICITDWMLTPNFLLRRPGKIQNQNIQNRLDGVLGQAAQRGVKIFIILFMQPAMFVNNDSQGAAKALQKMHKNIKVLRHPNVAVPIIWSHHEKLCVIDQKIGFMGGLDICYGRWDTPEHKLVENVLDKNKKLWDGCDYNNFRTSDIYQPRKFEKSNLNPQFQVRMPWHDIALQMRGDSVIDLLRHFVQYWYFVKSEYKMSLRRFFSSFKNPQHLKKHDIGRQIKHTTEQFFQEKWELLKQDVVEQFFPGHQERTSELLIEERTGKNQGNTRIQMLRSANHWSIGADIKNPQKSIHEAYKDLIKNSKSHIYIENQFFMGLENEIVKTLCERIIRAWNQKKIFKVIIVVPLLPGFEGDPGDQAATVLRIQIHWQKVAITAGDDSIYNTLQRQCPGINVQDYLFFFALRTHDVLKGSAITQIIYVHSKLMIVDDKRAICGSANINDRSLSGTGDSQIAVCIQENESSIPELFNLRCRLFDQHFALSPQQCRQITTPRVWNMIIQRAKTNTLIYRQVFGCVPDDLVTTHQQIQILAQQATYDASKLKRIIGHAVEYPLKFMDDEDLQFTMDQKQYFAPTKSFT